MFPDFPSRQLPAIIPMNGVANALPLQKAGQKRKRGDELFLFKEEKGRQMACFFQKKQRELRACDLEQKTMEGQDPSLRIHSLSRAKRERLAGKIASLFSFIWKFRLKAPHLLTSQALTLAGNTQLNSLEQIEAHYISLRQSGIECAEEDWLHFFQEECPSLLRSLRQIAGFEPLPKSILQAVLEVKDAIEARIEKQALGVELQKEHWGQLLALVEAAVGQRPQEPGGERIALSTLPNELLLSIFSHLSPDDRFLLREMGRKWRSLAEDPVLWHDWDLKGLKGLERYRFYRRISALLESPWNFSKKACQSHPIHLPAGVTDYQIEGLMGDKLVVRAGQNLHLYAPFAKEWVLALSLPATEHEKPAYYAYYKLSADRLLIDQNEHFLLYSISGNVAQVSIPKQPFETVLSQGHDVIFQQGTKIQAWQVDFARSKAVFKGSFNLNKKPKELHLWQSLLLNSTAKGIELWDVKSCSLRAALPCSDLKKTHLAGDFLVTQEAGSLKLWDLNSLEVLDSYQLEGQLAGGTSQLIEDELFVSLNTAEGKEVAMFDCAKGKLTLKKTEILPMLQPTDCSIIGSFADLIVFQNAQHKFYYLENKRVTLFGEIKNGMIVDYCSLQGSPRIRIESGYSAGYHAHHKRDKGFFQEEFLVRASAEGIVDFSLKKESPLLKEAFFLGPIMILQDMADQMTLFDLHEPAKED